MRDPERLLYSQAEAAKMLGVSGKTLLAEVRAGRLRYILIGATRKFKPTDLDQYIEAQAITEEAPCRSTGGRTRPIGGTHSPSTVVGFRALRAKERAETRER